MESLIIFGLYFIPVLFWSMMSFTHLASTSHWTLFAFGLLLASLGSIALWFLTEKKEMVPVMIPSAPVSIPIPTPIDPNPALKVEIDRLEQQLETLKSEYLLEIEKTRGHLRADYEKEKLEKEKMLIRAQERIQELEAKIDELEYEIKTLVDFNSVTEVISEEGWLASENEASRILNKWLDTSATLSIEQLSQLIQGEGRALVFLYGPQAGKALSANGHSLTLFGLTSEQFVEKFHTYLPKESLLWHEVLHKTSQEKWAEIRLADTKGVIAPILKGPLKGFLLGICY